MTFEQKLCCAMAAFAVASQDTGFPGSGVADEKWLQAYRHATGAYCDGNWRETRKGFGYLKSCVSGYHPKNVAAIAYQIVSKSCPGPNVRPILYRPPYCA